MDRLVWMPNSKGKLMTNFAWQELRHKGNVVVWSNLVWHKNNIPKHSIILWMTFKLKLHTKDKLVSFGLVSSITCAFCLCMNDNVNHFLFSCPFS